MKSFVRNSCFVIALLSIVSLLYVSVSVAEEYTYLAITSEFNPNEPVPGVPKTIGNTDQVIQAMLLNSWRPLPLLLPEGSGKAENYSYVGIWVTFDKPFEKKIDESSIEVLQLPNELLRPTSIEIISFIRYGTIVELGTEYIILDARDKYHRPTGELSRYTITQDTLFMKYEGSFEVGNGCELIVDSEGVVLAVVEANG